MGIKYRVDITKAIDIQWREALKLMEVGNFDDFRPLIKPYLNYGPLYKDSKEDIIREWKGVVSDSELQDIIKILASDVPAREWMGFQLTYVIDWTDRFGFLDSWEQVTCDMLKKWGVTNKMLHEISIENLDKGDNEWFRIKDEDNFSRIPFYGMRHVSPAMPSMGASVVLLDRVLKNMLETIQSPYYLLMMDNAIVYCVEKAFFEKTDRDKLTRAVQLNKFFTGQMLSDVIFYYDGGVLKKV